MAGEVEAVLLLLGLGVDDLSASPARLPAVKAVVRAFTREHARDVASQALALDTPGAIRTLLRGELALFGDAGLYATVGDRRIGRVREVEGGLELEVLGASGERCRVSGWCGAPLRAGCWEPGAPARALHVTRDERNSFALEVAIGDRGWCSVRLVP